MTKKALAVLGALLAVSLLACSEDEKKESAAREEPVPVDLRIAGMSAPAKVSFDAQGVLHASCRTDADCIAVLGYYHAQNRFWQMDLMRRVARGRGASLISLYDVEQDAFLRQFLSTRDGTPLEEAIYGLLDAETKRLLEAYAAGVNSWLADVRAGRNGARLTEEYALPIVNGNPAAIPDWEPLDSIAFARLMVWSFSDSSDIELTYGPAFSRLSAEKAVALFTLAPAARTYTMPASGVDYREQAPTLEARAPVDLEAIRALQQRLAPVRDLLESAGQMRRSLAFTGLAEGAGSNNWVIAPSRTAAGKALLANDPHLGLSNPPVWYFAQIDAVTEGEGTLHVGGGSFPGVPGFPIGRNANVAWGATVAYYDAADVYVEQLDEAGTAVLFDADGDGTPEEVPLVTREYTIEVFGAQPQTRTLRWVPHHGPVVAFSPETRTALSVRWTGHEPSNEIRAFLDLGRAANIAEAKAALQHFEVGAQNFVLIDTDGRIGWYPHARIPLRPWASFNQASPQGPGSLPPWLPLPGDGSAEWAGWLPEERIPQMFDPPKGFIATANQPMTDALEDGDPTNDGFPVLQTAAAVGFREARIVDLIESMGNAHTPETMAAIQADTRLLVAEAIVPVILQAAEEWEVPAATLTLLSALREWEYTCPTGLLGNTPDSEFDPDPIVTRETKGCTAFHYLLPKIYREAFGDELRMAGVGYTNELVRPLVLSLTGMPVPFDPDVLWDDVRTDDVVESRDEVLAKALNAAATEISAVLGADSNRWRWGRVHTVTFSHDLAAAQPALAHGPFSAQGGLFSVDVANPSASASGTNFSYGTGASLRIINEADENGIRTWFQLPGGQDLHRDGEHFGDLIDRYLAHESAVLPFTRAEVEEAARVTLTVGP